MVLLWVLLVPLEGVACSLALPFGEYDADGADAGDAGDAMSAYDGPSYVAVVTADAPLAYLRLDDGAGSAAPTIRQSTGHIVSGATYGASVQLGVPGALAHDDDTAVAVDGGSFAVDLTSDPVFSFPGLAPYSFEVWVLPDGGNIATDPTAYHSFWSRNEPDGSAGRVAYSGGLIGNLLFAERLIDGDDGTGNINFVTAKTAQNVWLHVVVTFDGRNHQLYFDGALQSARRWDAGLDFQAPVDLLIGGQAPDTSGDEGTFFVGAIDELAVYDHALAADRIAYHYAVGAGLSPLPPEGDP